MIRNIFQYQSIAEPLELPALGLDVIDWLVQPMMTPIRAPQLNAGMLYSVIEPEAFAIPITTVGYYFIQPSNKPHFRVTGE